MKEVSEELLTRLDLLAAKLGTTVEHLWEVATTQGFAEGLMALVAFVLSFTAFFYLVARTFRNLKLSLAARDNDDEATHGIDSLLSGILSIISFIVACANYSSIVYLINPEGYALKLLSHYMQ